MTNMKQYLSPLIRLVIPALFFFLFSYSAQAATASVSSNKLAQEEMFQLKITALERLSSDDVDFTPLKKDFYIGTPGFGSYTNIINGKKTVKSEWTLTLAPMRSGTLTIPALQAGNSKTQPITLTVTTDPTARTAKDLVEYQVKLSKPELYIGELNRLDTRLVIKASSRQIQSAKITPPTVEGNGQSFSLEPVGEEKQYQTVINGVEAIVVDQSYTITATQPGKFVIHGPSFNGAILDRGSRANSSRIVPVKTKPQLILVSVLDKPEDFQGSWLPSSELKLEQKWFDESGQEIQSPEALTLSVGSPITRQITLSAKGLSSSQIPNIKTDYPDSIRVYPESPQLSQDGDTAKLTLKQVLIVKNEGRINLPDIRLSWWNTKKKQAETASVPGLELIAEKTETPALIAAPTPVNNEPEVQIQTETITVKDAGYWPYLTLLSGIAWLITLALLINVTRSPSDIKPITETETDNRIFDQLTQAIKARDGFKAQALSEQWLKEHKHIDGNMLSEIKAELSQMQASLYAQNTTDWQDKKLIQLLKKANKKGKKQQQTPKLAPL